MPPSMEFRDGEPVELEALEALDSADPAIASQVLVERLLILITVELGRTTVTVKDLKNLRKGQIIGLDKVIGGALGIYANGQQFALGEVVAVAQKRYGVRVVSLTEDDDHAAEATP